MDTTATTAAGNGIDAALAARLDAIAAGAAAARAAYAALEGREAPDDMAFCFTC